MSVFEEQAKTIGLSLIKTDDKILIAENHEKYLKLKTSLEELGGSGKLAIAELLVIKGNIKKALQENPSLIKEDGLVEKKIGSFSLFTKNELPDQDVKIVHFQSLDTKIFKSDEYIIIKQKGNHDLIRKNPMFIEFLRGKITIDQLFDFIASLNIPNGLYIQEPIGFGDPKKLKKWKKIGTMVSVFSFICFIIVIILKYLMLSK
ncbi:hypothetical protein SAMN04487910_0378 [Aquimarina amphilecti]|uniref:Uncharacterized protein n=1 Tax=Aquimarina amphilecti TaxID=1038014 RepID=A0A1H7GM45_AQUAM|nr:hypothetical protein [Aquimarina amphilecti]SEK37590.1 hypothetical protein SAMN04487910_0378 [Aquimarina amphilecti]